MFRWVVMPALIAFLIVIGLAIYRWQGADVTRPLEFDEIITLDYYTWSQIDATGEPRRLRRMDDVYSLPKPGLLQLGMGVYRSVGVWKEPNNHIVNSALVNFAIAGGGPSESSIRVPALIGGVVAALLAYWVCAWAMRWTYAAPLAALWTFTCPYMVTYSQTARGYSWVPALQFLAIGLAYLLARRPSSIAWGAVCAATAVLTFMNVVSLGVDWLVPLFLALWFCPPRPRPDSPMAAEERTIWRRNLLVQMLALGAVALVFALDRLPALVSSSRQYGEPFTHLSHLLPGVLALFGYLFSDAAWMIWAVLGVCGMGLFYSPHHRFLGVLFALTLLISCLHFGLTFRLPYGRTAGYFLPAFILGAALLVEWTVRAVVSEKLRLLVWGFWAAGTALLVTLSLQERVDSEPLAGQLRQAIQRLDPPQATSIYMVLPPNPEGLKKYLPSSWLDDEDPLPTQGPLRLYLLTQHREEFGGQAIRMQMGTSESPIWVPLPFLKGIDFPPVDSHHIVGLKAESFALSSMEALPEKALIFALWRPDPERLGLDGSALMKHVAQSNLPFLRRNIRVPARLDFYSRIHGLELIATTTEDLQKLQQLLSSGKERFGGAYTAYLCRL